MPPHRAPAVDFTRRCCFLCAEFGVLSRLCIRLVLLSIPVYRYGSPGALSLNGGPLASRLLRVPTLREFRRARVRLMRTRFACVPHCPEKYEASKM